MASSWYFVYTNSTAALTVAVSNGSGLALGYEPLRWTLCLPFDLPSDVVASQGLIDSENAVVEIRAHNATLDAFFSDHPNLNGFMQLIRGLRGNMTHTWWIWEFAFTTCPSFTWSPASGYTNGTALSASVNATSAAIVPGSVYEGPQVCSGPTQGV